MAIFAAMKKILCFILFLLFLLACDGYRVTERLDNIDSLVDKEQYDSANVLLEDIHSAYMKADEQAHYNLLKTKLGYLTGHPLSSDSLLDTAITYYNKVGNDQKLADAYYYKSLKSRISNNYQEAIRYGKIAERMATNANDNHVLFKITENLAYLNGFSENYLLQLEFAKKALAIAEAVDNKSWMAYSYSLIGFSFANLNEFDSTLFYIEKYIPLIDYVYESDKAAFMANIGLFYKDSDPEKAKDYLNKALSYEELPGIYENLADICYAEGKKKEAYDYWRKALVTDGRYDKSNIFYSILSYDIERGKIDQASSLLDEVIAMKDSMLYKLRNDTIKDMQLRFDHEVAMHEADNRLISIQRIAMGLILALVLMALYIILCKKREEVRQKEVQMQLLAYTTEINQLKANRDKSLDQLKDLKKLREKDSQKIHDLEKAANDADKAIKKLNNNIKKLLDDESPKLKKGRILYDSLMDGGTSLKWNSKQEALFNNYYACINYRSYSQIKAVKRRLKLSPHNLFYLILKDMGKSDEEIKHIMAISSEGLRSLRSRTKPIEEDNLEVFPDQL